MWDELVLDLPVIWAAIIAIAVLAYVVLDGFDLGIGILFPFLRRHSQQNVALNTIAPVWDGNETWLILGGGGLMAAFPLAYAVLMPAIYAPLIAMLLALIFRGVAFEFRFRTRRWQRLWDRGFSTGSLVAAFCQGIILGTILQGVSVSGRAYAGGWFDWLTPFSIVTGLAVVAGYGLLGAGWLMRKTEGALQERAFELARPLALATLFFVALVTIWTPLADPIVAERWFSWPNILMLSPVPVLVALVAVGLLSSLQARNEAWPFPLTLCLFVLSFIGLGISYWPHIVPRSITIHEAAAPESSLGFLLVGTVILLPLIIGYTAYAYWVFRGKVDEHTGYH